MNSTIIIGRLGNTPELKTVKTSGESVDATRFTISNCFVENGVEVIHTHTVECYGKQAVVCANHLEKGDLCCVEGVLEDIKGETRVMAKRIIFLGSKRREHRQEESNNVCNG